MLSTGGKTRSRECREKNATATRATKKTRPRESPISAHISVPIINESIHRQPCRTVHKTHIAYIIHAVARDNQVKLNAFLNTSTKWSDFWCFCFRNKYIYIPVSGLASICHCIQLRYELKNGISADRMVRDAIDRFEIVIAN